MSGRPFTVTGGSERHIGNSGADDSPLWGKDDKEPSCLSTLPAGLRNHPTVRLFLAELRHIRRLTARQQRRAKQLFDQGDKEAFHQLLATGLPWVVSAAAQFMEYEDEFLDLVQEGFLGLARSIATWNPDRSPLQNYASYWIWTRLNRYRASAGTPVRIPVYLCERLRSFKKARQQGKASPDLDLPAGYEKEHLLATLLPPLSLNSDLSKFEGMSVWEQMDDPAENPLPGDLLWYEEGLTAPGGEEACVEAIYHEQVRDWLDQFPLTERERLVIRRRLGFDGEPQTLAEVGEVLGVTRERVRQVQARVLQRMRRSRRARLLDPEDHAPRCNHDNLH